MCEGTGEAPVCARCGVVFNAVSAALARTIAKARAAIVGYECPLYCVKCEDADRDDSLREHLYGERDAEQDEADRIEAENEDDGYARP
jgi:hypothetical protein